MDAIRFDIDDICNKFSTLPHMLPDDALCTYKLRKLGLSKDDNIIVYSGIGQMSAASAARVWWTLRVFGHQNVSILVNILLCLMHALPFYNRLYFRMAVFLPGKQQVAKLNQAPKCQLDRRETSTRG